MHLQVGAVVVFRVDAEIAGRAGHDLGEAEGADGRARADGEPAFLPDERLQERAPLNRGETRAAHTRKPAGFLGDADDELLDVFGRIPEHLCAAGIGVDLGIAVDRFDGTGRIAASVFQPRDHGRQALTAEAGLGIEDALKCGQLLAFDLGNEFAHGKLVGLNGEVSLAVAGLDDIARGQPAVIGRHTLGQGDAGQQAKREDMGQFRLQLRPPARQGA